MARDFGPVNVGIWGDPEWRDLTPAAQHLYLTLWTSADLSYCGVHDWRPGRLTGLSRGFTAEHMQAVADSLAARHFLVLDTDTEEALIRSWARWDGLLKKPRMAISYVAAYGRVASSTLRAVLVHETQKIRKLHPGLACWQDDRVIEVLDHPAISAKDLPTPSDPFAAGFADEVALGLPQTRLGVYPWVCTPPTPAPTPAPLLHAPRRSAAKSSAKPLPDSWEPSNEHRKRCSSEGIDLDTQVAKFKAHAEANDRRQANWNAAFTQWLLNVRDNEKRPSAAQSPHLPHASELEEAPSGMSDEESSEWMRRQREKRRA